MKHFACVLFCALLLPFVASANQRAQGYCTQGGQVVVTSGISSTTKVMQSYPACTVTVYLTGTLTLATIFSDNSSTPLSNPFTANSVGLWLWYAANGRYDVKLSGGGIPSPFTIGDILLADPAAGGTVVSSITAGNGISVNQSTGAVTVTNTWGPGTVSSGTQTQQLQVSPNQGNVTTYAWATKPMAIVTDYSYAPITPSSPSSLVGGGGAQVITVGVCPLGIYNSSTTTWAAVRIAGTGTPENKTPSGGTCSSATLGIQGGTIIISPTNNHSAGYTIGPAEAGFVEAANSSSLQVYAPCGTYDIYIATGASDAIALPPTSAGIWGCSGAGNGSAVGTTLAVHFSNGNVITSSGDAANSFRDFQILPDSNMTGGFGINLLGNENNRRVVENVTMFGVWNGILATGTIVIHNVLIEFVNRGLQIGDGVNYGFLSLDSSDILGSSQSQSNSASIYFLGTAGSAMVGTFLGGGQSAIILDGLSGLSNNEFIASGWFADTVNYCVQNINSGANLNWTLTGFECNVSLDAISLTAPTTLKIAAFRLGFGASASSRTGIVIGGAFNDVDIGPGTVYPTSASQNACIETPNSGGAWLEIHGVKCAITTESGSGTVTSGYIDLSSTSHLTVVGNDWCGAGTTAISLSYSESNVLVSDNNCVDNVTGTATVAAGTATFPLNPTVTMNSSAAVSGTAHVLPGQKFSVVNTNAAPGQWSGSGIGNTFTPLPSVPFACHVDSSSVLWCVVPVPSEVRSWCTGTVGSAETEFLNGAACSGATTATARQVIAYPGSITGLRVFSSANVTGGASKDVMTVFKNGNSTTLTCTISAAAATCSDTAHTVAVVAGDVITFQFVTATSDTAANMAASVYKF